MKVSASTTTGPMNGGDKATVKDNRSDNHPVVETKKPEEGRPNAEVTPQQPNTVIDSSSSCSSPSFSEDEGEETNSDGVVLEDTVRISFNLDDGDDADE